MATAATIKRKRKKPGRPRKVNYYATPGAQFSDEVAAVLGAVVDSLEKETGGAVTPELLVEFAKPRNSPIHDLFDWNDKEAAGKFRIQQARHFLSHVEVEIVVKDKPSRIRAFHNIAVVHEDADGKERTQRVYQSLGKISTNKINVAQVLGKAKGELKSWRNRYRMYHDHFVQIFEDIDDIV